MIKFILLFTFLFSINLFAHSFNFIAIGDAPYTETGGIDMFKKLVEQINARNPDFTIHVGDIKGGNEKCTDERILKVKKLFDQFNHPLLYTPGDNEWTDCFRASSGSMNPIERLSRIRSLFFTKAESFGQKKLQYVSQATEAKFKKFRENYYFPYKGGLVASVHIVGSNNNLRNEDEEAVKEFHERQVANLAWLDKIFNASKNLKFLILFFHAEIGWGSTKDKFKGYQAVYKKMEEFAQNSTVPALFVHGDDHKFTIDHPIYYVDKKTGYFGNRPFVTRLQVYGFPNVRAVEVKVEPNSPQPFAFYSLEPIPWQYKK